MHEFLVAPIISFKYRFWSQQFVKSIFQMFFLKFLHFPQCRFVKVERKANHLGKSIVWVVPFVDVVGVDMLIVPLFLILYDIGKLIECYDVVFLKLTSH